MKFYEVTLSDCDCRNVTVHVWDDGSHTFPGLSRAAGQRRLRALVQFFNDPDAPQYVLDWHLAVSQSARTARITASLRHSRAVADLYADGPQA